MQMKGLVISNARMVLPDTVLDGHLVVEQGRIRQILPADRAVPRQEGFAHLDAQGRYVLPGLVDIHSDAIEKEVQPRPNTLFPMRMAMVELEKKLAAAGITTMYHSLSLGVGLSLRGEDKLLALIDEIVDYRRRRSMVRHLIHLRYELIHLEGIERVRERIDRGVVDYLSFMIHAPGIGQYNKPGSFEAYVMKNQGVTRAEAEDIARSALERKERVRWDEVARIAEHAAQKGIAIASHDDDSPDMVDRYRRLGVTISEFPITLDVARYVRRRGMHVCVGAPNVIRGQSHDGNLSATEAIEDGSADLLCSDYHPPALLPAVFHLHGRGMPLPEAVRMASLNPGNALGLGGTGAIREGYRADLLLIELMEGYPVVRSTLVDGVTVYSSDYYVRREPGRSEPVG